MKNLKRKGFTIVELVIVIAVIAILAAVLIPTFVNLTKKANLSADQVAVRNMNTLLATEFATEKPTELKQVIDMLDKNGYNVDALTPLSKGYTFVWNQAENKIELVEISAAGEAPKLETGASFINVEVSTDEELRSALANGSDVTLTNDLKLEGAVITLNGDITIDLNRHNLDASVNPSRPFDLSNDSSLTINATGSTINCGLFGLINVVPNAKATVIINGGTFLANTQDGSFIRMRENSNVNIILNNVNYIDTYGRNKDPNGAFIIDTTHNKTSGTVTINGGSFTGDKGFAIPYLTFYMKNASIVLNSIVLEASKGSDVTIENCTIETKKVNPTYTAAVFSSYGGKMTVTGSTFKGKAQYAYSVLNTGGTLIASNNKIEVANEYTILPLNPDATASVTINGVVQK